jgi:hypothetical protein
MERTEAEKRIRPKRGRRPLPPELNGKFGSKRRRRWFGYPVDRQRALLHELAYIRNEKPTGANLHWAFESNQDEYLSEQDFLGEDGWAKKQTPRSNNTDNYLRAKNIWSRHTEATFIEIGGHRLAKLACNPFWPVYKEQPSHGLEFLEHFRELDLVKPKFVYQHRSPYYEPPISACLRAIEKCDSLRCLAGAMLVFGRSLDYDRERIPDAEAAYERALIILCRISCVVPFARFGGEFAENVIQAMLTNRSWVPAGDWKERIANTRNEYRQIIKHGREMGVLRFGQKYFHGRNNEELATLRLADEVGWSVLRNTFYRLHRHHEATKLLEKLYLRFYHPSSDLYG